MMAIYLAIGIFFGIFNLFMVHSKSFDDYGLEHYGKVIPQWKKMAYVLFSIPAWPVLVLYIILGKNPENE